MKAQLEMLPPLDPSSPWNPDGTRRPKPPNPKDYELPLPSEAGRGPESGTPSWLDMLPSGDRVMFPRPRQAERHPQGAAETGWPPAGHPGTPREVTHDDRPTPLTDAEYAEHIAELRGDLARAHAKGLATDTRYTTDERHVIWTKERRKVHDEIINDLYAAAADVPNERKAVMTGGLCGSGKTTVLERHAGIARSKYLTVSADEIKEDMAKRGLIPQLKERPPMEVSDLVHEESSHIARRLARRALADGKNISWDITMESFKSTNGKIDNLRDAGYTITGIFVDISVDTSVRRAEARYRKGHERYRNNEGYGGRYLPPEVVRESADSQWGSVNRRTFEETKQRFDSWSLFDNSVDGREPRLLDAGGRRRRGAPDE